MVMAYVILSQRRRIFTLRDIDIVAVSIIIIDRVKFPARRKLLKNIVGYYGYWVILTYMNVISAVVGIYFALKADIRMAVICLLFSGLCDMFDGTVAKRKDRDDRQKSYGVQIDALSDVIAFGVLPVVIGYALQYEIIDGPDFLFITYQWEIPIDIIFYAIYLLAALIRLGYFNVLEIELLNKDERSTHFIGLPVTTIALLVPLYYAMYLIFDFYLFAFYPILLLITAVFYLVRIKVPKPRGILQVIVGLVGLINFLMVLILGWER
jgi:CDP-diacylglycerol--serine O-phosphatidyltransferase